MADLNQSSIALAMLFQRLNWPVSMTRWRAAREIRALVQTPETRDTTTHALLDFVDACRTESEVAAVLNLVAMVAPAARPAKTVLISRIRAPSIISEYLLQHCYGSGMGGWRSAHSGAPPGDFEEDSYFLEHRKAHCPPILLSNLLELERESGMPFQRQWAFEWRSVREATQTRYTRYPHYFDGRGDARSGIVGQYLQRQSEVYRSAYLRVITHAVSEWGLPESRALREACELLPAIKGMFDLDPIPRPEWLGDFPDRCAIDGADLRELVRAKMTEPYGRRRIVSLSTPFSKSTAEFGNLTVAAYLVSPDFEIDPKRLLFEPLDLLQTGSTLDLSGPMPNTSVSEMTRPGAVGSSVSVCGNLMPLPFGHWQSDYLAVGLSTVAAYCLPGKAEFVINGGVLEQHVGGSPVASMAIWNDGWTPHYHVGGSTRCGVLTTLEASVLEELPRQFGRKLAWFAKVQTWRRKAEYGEFKSSERNCLCTES